MPDWPSPEQIDASYASAAANSGGPQLAGPLQYLYPDGFIEWPQRLCTAAEWMEVMSISAKWPNLSAEQSGMFHRRRCEGFRCFSYS